MSISKFASLNASSARFWASSALSRSWAASFCAWLRLSILARNALACANLTWNNPSWQTEEVYAVPCGPGTYAAPYGPGTDDAPYGPGTYAAPYGPGIDDAPYGPGTVLLYYITLILHI